MNSEVPAIDVLGLKLARLTTEAALAAVATLHEQDAPALVFHANAHTLNSAVSDLAYADVLRRADLVLNDGKGVMLGGLLLGERFPADLNGNHFTPLVLQLASEKGWPVYFLGAKPGVADHAASLLAAQIRGLEVVGVRDGYFTPAELDDVLGTIRNSGAKLLLVALGNPEQERWLDEHLDKTGARIGVGVGAFFDFQAGRVRRAPAWMNRIGLEWVHRFVLEPRRMWRRYLIGNPLFVARVLRQRFQKGRAAGRR
ncbi:MAG: WecB/TagA/CpsF family glycosyltransferase [Actinomycetota bacterium]